METLMSLLDVNFILINRIFVLLAILLFFVAAAGVRIVRRKPVNARITMPIKLSLFCFLLLWAEMALVTVPGYQILLERVQTLVVMLCLAQMITYLIIDIYLILKLKREVPSFQRDIVTLLVYLGVGIVSLRLVFKIDLSAIAVTTTVITAAVAFALQNTLANALSGFSIQSDKLLAVGNWINIKDKNIFGEIINVGFRYTTLRSTEMNLVIVPNSIIMQNVVVIHGSQNSIDKPTVMVDVMLGYDMPPEKAKGLLMQVMHDEAEILAEPVPAVRLLALNDSGITYQLRFCIASPPRRMPVQDLIYSRVWYAVNREGYSFPFPHRQIITTEARPPYEFSRELVSADLQGSDLFAMLDAADIEQLAAQAPVRVFGSGELIVHQGDGGSSLFIVLKGDLLVEVDGKEVGRIAEGSFFGEMSLLTGAPRKATVRAIREVWLAEVTKELIEPLLRAHPQMMENLSAILAEREQQNRASFAENAAQPGKVKNKDYYLTRLKQFFKL
jgi:small-conductance mechanosensitive channel/CRP-like cAMP-binding protein